MTKLTVPWRVSSSSLREARGSAIAALEREQTPRGDLELAASALGRALRDAANDDRLWRRVQGATPVAELTDWERLSLQVIAETDWEWLLHARGYDAKWDAPILARSTTEVLSGGAVDAQRARTEVRTLAGLLMQQTASTSLLRKRIKGGVRVAGRVAIVAAVAGAAFAAAPLLPGVLVAHTLGTAVLGGVMQDGAISLVEKVAGRAVGEARDKVPPPETAAQRLLSTIAPV